MAKTGHPNFVLKYQSPWRGTPHIWSITSSHSGASFGNAGDMEIFMQAVHGIIASFFVQNSPTFLKGFAYYDGINSAALVEGEFADAAASQAGGWTPAADYGGSYEGSPTTESGLETCVVLEAPVGLSKTGKPVLMRKFIHAVAGGSTSDSPPFGPLAASFASNLGNGSLPGSRVLITASGKQGSWIANPYFGAHKMPRRKKKSAGSSFLGNLVDLRTAIAAGEALGEL